MARRTSYQTTMKDVAALAGVSVQTVSFVINNNPVISPETRQRVQDAIAQLHYTPDASARSLRSGRSHVVGMLIPDAHNPHFWAILDGAEQEALANGYSLILTTTSMQRERERQAFDALARQRLDGLILFFTYPEDFSQDIALLRQKQIPIVTDGAQFEEVDRVWFHYRAAARELMDHLFSLGHRRIAFIQGVGRQGHLAGKDRTDIYQQKMEEQAIPGAARMIIPCGNTLEDGFAAANQMLDLNPRPTAIIGMNDLMAYGALQAALQRGLRVPQDISIAGFDDDAMFRLLSPPLTTGSVNGTEFGALAVRLLLNRLKDPDLPPQKAHVASRLVVRGSTGPLPTGWTYAPISAHPNNPHYFLFRGQPTVLITSAEHYGAVINLDFDYLSYLDTLAAYDLNYTRIYAGAYVEPEHYFIHDNTLGPRVGRYCLPWGRSEQPGFAYGGSIFDLDQWNPAYFERLLDFVAQAGQRGIVVEVCLFNAMYPDTWVNMPLYHANNLQGVSQGTCQDFQTLKEPALTARQAAYVRKITAALNACDNVILEICDEPGIHGTPPEEYTPWLEYLAGVIAETEQALPHRHLLAQQICGTLHGPGDVSGDRRISLIVSQYIGGTAGGQFGGLQLLDALYGHEKPIELNETAYYPIWYEGDRPGAARVEAWEFILGGGAGFNHLNGLFSTFNPSGAGTGNEPVLQALQNLLTFMGRFDFVRMRRETGLLAGGAPPGALARAISEPGRQYALYLHHSRCPDGVKYIVQPGEYQESLGLNLPAGSYSAEWVDPASGAALAEVNFQHAGGVYPLRTPLYTVDVALRVHSVAQQ